MTGIVNGPASAMSGTQEPLKYPANSAVLELDLAGTVRYASKEWLQLTGINSTKMIGRPISDFVCMPDRDIFLRASLEMQDPAFHGGSVTIWARMHDATNPNSSEVNLEAQGITVDLPSQSSTTGFADAVIWLVSQYTPRPAVSVTLPDELVRTTGFATDVFAAYLESLADAVRAQSPVPTPPQELCRICESFVKSWWFERHHWLCAVEHKYLDRVRYALDLLHDHREDLQQVYLQVLAQIQMQPQLVPKHAVHVPSPLARSVTSVHGDGIPGNKTSSPTFPPSGSPVSTAQNHQYQPLQAALTMMIEHCDTIIELNPVTVEARIDSTDSESLYGQENAHILNIYNDWKPLQYVPKMLEYSMDVTVELIDGVVASFLRFAKFLRYGRVLWEEVESQVLATIEATISAAESTDATVIIDQASVSEGDEEDEQFSTPNNATTENNTSCENNNHFATSSLSKADTQKPASEATRVSSAPMNSNSNSPSNPNGVVDTPVSPRTRPVTRRSMSSMDFSDAETEFDQPLNYRNRQSGPEVDFSVYSEYEQAEPVLYSDDEDEMKYILNLKRQRSVHSRRSSYESSSVRSPHLSPYISPHNGPYYNNQKLLGTGTHSPNMTVAPAQSSTSPMPPSSTPPIPQFPAVTTSTSLSSISSLAPSVATPARRLSRSIVSTAQSPSSDYSSLNSPEGAFEDQPKFQQQSQQQHQQLQRQSIRDYEIIKPISRGAYGVVYLAKKRLTSELVAIKVLQKSQMVAKNQVTHIKHERRILISTARSPYVATLFYTFQSRDYLYLVMEYVPGGDVAALLKKLGCLTETWAKQYISEVIVAVDSLHTQGILHRDLKPDNLLIDKHGHLKLSDFGLSSARTEPRLRKMRSRTSSSGSIGSISYKQASPTPSTSSTDDMMRLNIPHKIQGTPDYLAPETIMGRTELTETADWWAVGCIFFELLYGYPPFNDETPQKIFQNITKGDYEWPSLPPEMDISPCAKDFIAKLLIIDPSKRLGANGSQEVMSHPYFGELGINAGKVFTTSPEYVPEATNPLSTSNFDDRGALELRLPTQETNLIFSMNTQDQVQSESMSGGSSHKETPSLTPHEQESNSPTSMRNYSLAQRDCSMSSQSSLDVHYGGSYDDHRQDSRTSESSVDEFGNFAYRNLPVLEKANNDVITKIRDEDRRLSFSGSVSPLILPSSPSHCADSPMSSGPSLVSAGELSLNNAGQDTNAPNNINCASSPLLLPHSSGMDELRRRSSSPSIILPAPPPAKPPQVTTESLLLASHPRLHEQNHIPITQEGNNGTFSKRRSSGSLSRSSSKTSISSLGSNGLKNKNSATHLVVPQAGALEEPEKDLAFLRMRRRQQLRRLPLTQTTGNGKPHKCPNVLVCGTMELLQKFTKVGCCGVLCQDANEVCIHATSPVAFNLIVLDLPATSPIPDTEVVRIVRGTVNPNRNVPILKVANPPYEDGTLPAFNADDPAEIQRVLKNYVNVSSIN